MGKELTRVVVEGQIFGEPLGGTRIILANRAPIQGVLMSYSERGAPKHEHQIDLQTQMQRLLEQPGGLFLFDPITHYAGEPNFPNVAVRSYLRYESILI